MALKGNLRDFTITQLLNLINLARKSGSLVIEGAAQDAQIAFREGKLAFARMGRDDGSLATILHKNNKISLVQYRTIKERGSRMSDKELGLLLINAGYLTQEDIITSVQIYFIGIIKQLYTWMDGYFRFETDSLPPEDKITVRVDLESLIIEGVRQMKEWEHLQEEIPSLDMALKFTERPGTNLRNISLNVEEWRVVSYINPKNSIRQISRATKMNELEIRRTVYALLQAGLVEIIRPEGMPIAARPSYPSQNKEEQKSLVTRLINRIRNL
jgi:predicted DNA-binding transcriptional regulator